MKNAIEHKILKFLGCFVLSMLGSAMFLNAILEDSVEGIAAFILLLIVAVPISLLLYYLFVIKKSNTTVESPSTTMESFNNKRIISVEDMSMKMMHASFAAVGKIQAFNDVDDLRSMAVSIGYFYGFLKLHLNHITSLDTANTIIQQSITHFEDATKEKAEFANFGHTVRTMANNASANMQYIMKETSNPFMDIAVFYLKDLYDSSTVDMSRVDIAENNMRYLYGTVSNLTKDIKIVK